MAGILMLSRTANGGLALNVSSGLSGAAPEQCEYVEFPLTLEQARALRDALDP